MIFYSTSTSRKLERYARARGLNLGICYTPNNNGGRYHVVSEDGEPLSRWRGLGWSRSESETSIEMIVAFRGEE